MKNFILGVIVAGAVLFGGNVLAKTIENRWYETDHLKVGNAYIYKSFDEDTNTICYSFSSGLGTSGAISCLKNN